MAKTPKTTAKDKKITDKNLENLSGGTMRTPKAEIMGYVFEGNPNSSPSKNTKKKRQTTVNRPL
ncbi:hypothetical protein Lqui_0725 [Legionella quinlivanii]|uniref:Uncharacterized protein n=1 Tax=Legionella quinlivanii TaxID=45073 RepID=A0A0W0Y4L5_9GAMM|nr:hypothetical protein [Legionella quinlivanii]KTD51881.1 hypothetical protein Lqui_0725 [Legionella quinlivanii]MCW8452142.1 hypothetical protein [Legionella quinlivanii]SEF83744.1 hypothetical protein SAMN02746093_01186 [Legionella quinlivanii DSM 21216]STY09657.1 Uncharacterised protein [Legionella quinlivanii]